MTGMVACHAPSQAAAWLRAQGCVHLRGSSQAIEPGDGLAVWPGATHDGAAFVPQAMARGGVAALIDAASAAVQQRPSTWSPDWQVGYLPQLQAQASAVADAFYGQPSTDLTVAAVTGTNGKSTVAWWLAHALNALTRRSGLIGTLGQGWPNALQPSPLTTPDALQLQAALATLRDQGASACVMEASSIGLAQHRLEAIRVRLAIYTHFSQDHLDFHGDMASYWQAKRRLFDWPSLQAAVVHVGDPQGQDLANALQHLPVWRYALQQQDARVVGLNPKVDAQGVTLQLQERDLGGAVVAEAAVHWPVLGAFNVRNRLAVLASLRALDVDWPEAVMALQTLPPVPGRMQPVALQAGQPLVVVDYAHTPDALSQALQALQPVAKARGGRLWCVFGCGGNRDRSKRAPMGQAAQALADQVVLTTDNPRDEPPQAILDDIMQGLGRAPTVIVDRAAAIAQTVAQAQANDVVLLAGKGHERYQECAGMRVPFDDVAHAQLALEARA